MQMIGFNSTLTSISLTLPTHCPYCGHWVGNDRAMQARKKLVNGVANYDLPQHPQDAFQTVSLSLPIRRLAAQ
ncbi:MAG: hypothetical protein PHY48_00095 [Candidatus Cloacimonetes bacterium]|nr:hypothetical protein [Candidatus Cloacimonadota bacterium]